MPQTRTPPPPSPFPSGLPDAAKLAEWVTDARYRTLALIADLDDSELLGPRLETVNPLLWEIGHVAWFQEKWALRHTAGRPPIRRDADQLWDSIAIPHDVRWDLPVPTRRGTIEYIEHVRDAVLEELTRGDVSPQLAYFTAYAVFHEDMHTEAFTYTRQTLAYRPPSFDVSVPTAGPPSLDAPAHTEADRGDAQVAPGSFMLGAVPEGGFAFDNEKWAHPVELPGFSIARTPVTEGEFAEFVEDDGYDRSELWSKDGWAWRQHEGAGAPLYWQRGESGEWIKRRFDGWGSIEPSLPMIHVNWHEAQAYCRWRERRLPTEAEWEAAATSGPDHTGSKPRFPWGDGPVTPQHAALDWSSVGGRPVDDCPAGDAANGCRQMIGNVWEWTNSVFLPYDGFVRDPYEEYSEPWFGSRKVLRGGSWATRSRMIRNTWRNFFTPDRRDVFGGFRTCALT